MLDGHELTTLQWHCGCVYVCRRETQISKEEFKSVLRMRRYFRADTRPPEALIVECSRIVAAFWQRRWMHARASK